LGEQKPTKTETASRNRNRNVRAETETEGGLLGLIKTAHALSRKNKEEQQQHEEM
jgi:hypothetical protein